MLVHNKPDSVQKQRETLIGGIGLQVVKSEWKSEAENRADPGEG